MKKLEKILVMLIITGFVMRLLKIHEGSLIQFIATAVLAALYALGGAYYIMKDAPLKGVDILGNDLRKKAGEVLKGLAAGIVFGYTLLAVLFKTMYWQNGSLLVETALMALCILIAVAIAAYSRNRKEFNRQLLIRSAVYFVVTIIIWLVPTNMFLLR
jgi:hypothetical protein